jgi:hypothetical protein
MTAPALSLVLVEAATLVDDDHALAVQDKLLRLFEKTKRVADLPLVSKSSGSDEPLLGSLAAGSDGQWGWSSTHIYRSLDGTRWFAASDAPVPIARMALARQGLLVRTTDGKLHVVDRNTGQWSDTDSVDDVVAFNRATDPPGQHAKGLACLPSAREATLILRFHVRGCFNAQGGQVKLTWSGKEARLESNLADFKEMRVSGSLLADEARSFARKLVRTSHQSDPLTCRSTTSEDVSIYWQCDAGMPGVTYFAGYECFGSDQRFKNRVETTLEQARALVAPMSHAN